MAILHDKDRRDALTKAKAVVRDLERPEREARKIIQAKARRDREKAIDRSRTEQRAPRERDPGYLAFVRRTGCVVGAITGEPCQGPIDAMHQRFTDPKAGRVNPGMGRKPDDRWALGGCRHHHSMQHAGNERRFWSEYVGADPTDLAVEMHIAYSTGGDGLAVLRRFTPTVRL